MHGINGEITMKHTIELSKRLTTVASFLSKGTFFADIGTDHAYLPCYVCLSDLNAKAIAGEVNAGPYEAARKTVHSYGLSHSIDVRLGNGLHVIHQENIQELVIAGMGGTLITSILNQGKEHLQTVKRIIVQPNITEINVRKWFINNDFIITNEQIILENNHFYEIIVADRLEQKIPSTEQLDEKQLLFGPLLLKNKSTLFYEKWELHQKKLADVVKQMKQASIRDKEKIIQFEKELAWLEEVLEDEKDC